MLSTILPQSEKYAIALQSHNIIYEQYLNILVRHVYIEYTSQVPKA